GTAVLAEEVPAAGSPDLVRDPVAHGERWVQPFQPDHARPDEAMVATILDGRLDRSQPLAEAPHEIDRGVLRVRHRADRGDRVQDSLDGRGLERNDARLQLERPDDV